MSTELASAVVHSYPLDSFSFSLVHLILLYSVWPSSAASEARPLIYPHVEP